MSNELSPRQRDLLARLFESELTVLRDAALTAGSTPASVGDIADRRRRVLDAQQTGQADTPDDPDGAADSDEDPDGGGVAERR